MRASLKWVIFRAWVVNCQRAEPFPAETRYFFRQKQCVTQSGNRNLEIAVAGIVSVHDFVVLGSYGRQNVEARWMMSRAVIHHQRQVRALFPFPWPKGSHDAEIVSVTKILIASRCFAATGNTIQPRCGAN